ncbi:MAG: hypothetical protein EXR79_15385 [Myxococcales bacterium]|nr:hypothetical protein [Myxococcales bacterium]
MLTYQALRQFLRFATGIFFRNIEVVGQENVAGEGRAVMFAGNHPNSLLDPVLIIATSSRMVRCAAKDVLFKSALLRPLLDAMGAVPVARKMDHAAKSGQADGAVLDNQGAFDALANVLAGGGAMGIFPEGLSHDDSQLQKLKTGAARIALDVAHRLDQPVDIVPTALVYLNPKNFRSSVLVQYGSPIEVASADVEVFLRDERAAVRDVTARIDAGLRALTINATDWDTVRVLDAVRRLYQPPGLPLWQRVELARRFNEVYPTVRDLPEVKALFVRVRSYLEQLHDMGLTDRDLRRSLGPRDAFAHLLAHLGLLLLWVPLALPGIVLHAPVALLVRALSPLLTPRTDALATTKLVLGVGLLAVAYAGLVAAAAWQFGVLVALAVAGGLPLTGYAALRVIERGAAMGRVVRTLVRLLSLEREAASLRTERDALQDAVMRAVDRLRPADMQPLIERPLPLEPRALATS